LPSSVGNFGQVPAPTHIGPGRRGEIAAQPVGGVARGLIGSGGAASAATADRDGTTPPEAESATPGADDLNRELAAVLVAEKMTRKPVEVVVRILAAYDSGDPLNRIAKDVRVHHSAVSRVIGAAAAHRQRTLEVV
jgi:hypothetical protein